jgi:hypothetical protein
MHSDRQGWRLASAHGDFRLVLSSLQTSSQFILAPFDNAGRCYGVPPTAEGGHEPRHDLVASQPSGRSSRTSRTLRLPRYTLAILRLSPQVGDVSSAKRQMHL